MNADPDWTFFLLKPDAIERGLTAEIRIRLEAAGFVVRLWREVVLQSRDIDALFPDVAMRAMTDLHLAVVRSRMVEYLCGGPCIYVEVIHASSSGDEEIFRRAIRLRGARFLPEHCEEGTIRFDYRECVAGASRLQMSVTAAGTPLIDGVVKNLVHSPFDSDERDRQAKVLLGST